MNAKTEPNRNYETKDISSLISSIRAPELKFQYQIRKKPQDQCNRTHTQIISSKVINLLEISSLR